MKNKNILILLVLIAISSGTFGQVVLAVPAGAPSAATNLPAATFSSIVVDLISTFKKGLNVLGNLNVSGEISNNAAATTTNIADSAGETNCINAGGTVYGGSFFYTGALFYPKKCLTGTTSIADDVGIKGTLMTQGKISNPQDKYGSIDVANSTDESNCINNGGAVMPYVGGAGYPKQCIYGSVQIADELSVQGHMRVSGKIGSFARHDSGINWVPAGQTALLLHTCPRSTQILMSCGYGLNPDNLSISYFYPLSDTTCYFQVTNKTALARQYMVSNLCWDPSI